jgi:hypothetical protein
MNRGKIVAILRAYHVPPHEWGKGQAKTFEHFLYEVQSGESTLVERDRKLVRLVPVSRANIFYKQKDGKVLKLVEDRQVFKEGQRERRRNISWSLIEKRKRDENPEDSIRRGIREELGIHDGYTLKRLDQVTDEMRPSISYPGTYIVVMAYNFEADLTTAVYHQEGYIERQKDKTTYFIWKNV